ncbi:MAG TPA: YjfB family protein [Phycisphaerales bacterium]|nr:YjfB family protein [Phycisphaerales bacterium]
MNSNSHSTDELSMDVATASALSQVQLMNQVDVAVAKKALNTQEAQGQAALELMDQAVQLARQSGNPQTSSVQAGSVDIYA